MNTTMNMNTKLNQAGTVPSSKWQAYLKLESSNVKFATLALAMALLPLTVLAQTTPAGVQVAQAAPAPQAPPAYGQAQQQVVPQVVLPANTLISPQAPAPSVGPPAPTPDRKSTRLNSSH